MYLHRTGPSEQQRHDGCRQRGIHRRLHLPSHLDTSALRSMEFDDIRTSRPTGHRGLSDWSSKLVEGGLPSGLSTDELAKRAGCSLHRNEGA